MVDSVPGVAAAAAVAARASLPPSALFFALLSPLRELPCCSLLLPPFAAAAVAAHQDRVHGGGRDVGDGDAKKEIAEVLGRGGLGGPSRRPISAVAVSVRFSSRSRRRRRRRCRRRPCPRRRRSSPTTPGAALRGGAAEEHANTVGRLAPPPPPPAPVRGSTTLPSTIRAPPGRARVPSWRSPVPGFGDPPRDWPWRAPQPQSFFSAETAATMAARPAPRRAQRAADRRFLEARQVPSLKGPHRAESLDLFSPVARLCQHSPTELSCPPATRTSRASRWSSC